MNDIEKLNQIRVIILQKFGNPYNGAFHINCPYEDFEEYTNRFLSKISSKFICLKINEGGDITWSLCSEANEEAVECGGGISWIPIYNK